METSMFIFIITILPVAIVLGFNIVTTREVLKRITARYEHLLVIQNDINDLYLTQKEILVYLCALNNNPTEGKNDEKTN